MLGALGIESSTEVLRQRGAIVVADDFVKSVRAGRDFTDADLSGFELAGAQLDAAPFRKANLHSANLTKTSLHGAMLSEANLCWAKLDGANLNRADLSLAHLIGAGLTAADLSHAQCRGAGFNGAKLRNSNLAGADLSDADFRQADLTGANLTGAVLDGARWNAAILEDIRGISPAQAAELKSQAARWKHDWANFFDKVVPPLSIAGWLLCWPLGIAFLLFAGKRSPGKWGWKLIAAIHAIAGVPLFAFIFFFVTRTSPTAQLSVSSSGWSLWFGLWPVLTGTTLLTMGIFVPVVISLWWTRRRHQPCELKKPLVPAAFLTCFSLAASLGILLQLVPDA